LVNAPFTLKHEYNVFAGSVGWLEQSTVWAIARTIGDHQHEQTLRSSIARLLFGRLRHHTNSAAKQNYTDAAKQRSNSARAATSGRCTDICRT
jgi:hypothetical protein